ncbi:MAG: hypothetical protein MUD08_10240, partial [Cytophagales bacterium]|nr:hypothetical protein [Cytophagales bacterium]
MWHPDRCFVGLPICVPQTAMAGVLIFEKILFSVKSAVLAIFCPKRPTINNQPFNHSLIPSLTHSKLFRTQRFYRVCQRRFDRLETDRKQSHHNR